MSIRVKMIVQPTLGLKLFCLFLFLNDQAFGDKQRQEINVGLSFNNGYSGIYYNEYYDPYAGSGNAYYPGYYYYRGNAYYPTYLDYYQSYPRYTNYNVNRYYIVDRHSDNRR